VVHAIQDAAVSIVSGSTKFDRTADTLRKIQGMIYPERAEALEEKAKRTEKFLKKEMDGGPMKVQRLDYGGDKRRKKRH
jgi:hypothetical protein